MKSVWPYARLESLAERIGIGPFGSSIRVATFVDEPGVPVISGQHLRGFKLNGSPGHNFVTEEHAQRLRSAKVWAGDVVLTHAGSIGQAAYIPADAEYATYVISQRQFYVRPDRAKLLPEFLTYYLHSAEGRHRLLANTVQTGVPSIAQPVSYIRTIEVPVPPLAEQREIAGTLGALDDRIESNRGLVALIPQLIRTYVDAALSRGSRDVAVSSLARFVNGGAYTNRASGTTRMVLRIAELNGEPGPSTVYSDIDVPDDQTARAGDILMSWSGSLGVYRWFRDEAVINQHIFKVIPTGYPAWLVFDRIDAVMPFFRGVAADKATTMGHIQRGHLDSTSVEIPAVAEIERLNRELATLWDRLLLVERENVKLAALRDALLPELLSGRIRVPEASQAAVDTAAAM